LGIFLSVIMLFFNARNFTSSLYLSLFFFLISLFGIIQYILLYSKSVVLVGIFFMNFGVLNYLIGPALYIYSRSLLTDNPNLKKSDLLHLLPIPVFLVMTFQHYLSPWSVKLDIAAKIVEDSAFIGNYTVNLPFGNFLTATWIFLSRPLLVLFYIIAAILLFVSFKKYERKTSVFSGQKFMWKWITVFLLFSFILAFSYTMMILETIVKHDMILLFSFNTLLVASSVGLAGLLIAPILFPEILYGLPRLPDSTMTIADKNEKMVTSGDEIKKREVNFESAYLILIGEKTKACMTEFQPYLQPDCNLALLSRLTDIPVHHLSYYFREIKKQTFNDYRNEWRVNHAKDLIRMGKARELTLESIGLISGFSSRNAFLTSFKKSEGITPTAFTARIAKSTRN
jgi:AraC-like DNA-binding protein